MECPTLSLLERKDRGRWKCVRKPISAAIKASGLDWFCIKDLRRQYGIRLAEGGAEMHGIQSMLRQSSVKTTEEYYAHFSPNYAARRALQVLQGGKAKQAEKDGRQTGGEKPLMRTILFRARPPCDCYNGSDSERSISIAGERNDQFD
jgi:hypothetical protein